MVSNKGELINSLLVSQKNVKEMSQSEKNMKFGFPGNDFQMSTYTYTFTYTFSYVNIYWHVYLPWNQRRLPICPFLFYRSSLPKHTVDGRNPHLGCIKPCKYWGKLFINWCRILPSTVGHLASILRVSTRCCTFDFSAKATPQRQQVSWWSSYRMQLRARASMLSFTPPKLWIYTAES